MSGYLLIVEHVLAKELLDKILIRFYSIESINKTILSNCLNHHDLFSADAGQTTISVALRKKTKPTSQVKNAVFNAGQTNCFLTISFNLKFFHFFLPIVDALKKCLKRERETNSLIRCVHHTSRQVSRGEVKSLSWQAKMPGHIVSNGSEREREMASESSA